MKMDRELALREVSYLAIRKAAGVGSQVDQDHIRSGQVLDSNQQAQIQNGIASGRERTLGLKGERNEFR
jgi:hypothetical protein